MASASRCADSKFLRGPMPHNTGRWQGFRALFNAEVLVTSCLLNWKEYNCFLYEQLLKTLEKWPHSNFLMSYYILSLILRTGARLYQRHLGTCDKRKKDIGQENGRMTQRKNAAPFTVLAIINAY